METKTCFKCGENKPLTEYYKHNQMADGYLGKCKSCAKLDTKHRGDSMSLNPEWVELERKRSRDKYYRLGYKEKHKPDKGQKTKAMQKYTGLYPEKKKAHSASQHIACPDGYHNHHWSYNEEHWKDVIQLTKEQHYTAHRYIQYDPERKMYRGLDGLLLDTREVHENYIKHLPF